MSYTFRPMLQPPKPKKPKREPSAEELAEMAEYSKGYDFTIYGKGLKAKAEKRNKRLLVALDVIIGVLCVALVVGITVAAILA